jgi:Icc-related predicted phosphoesterase
VNDPSRALCLFASDLHGHPERYGRLLELAASEPPAVLLLGGDLLPLDGERFVASWLEPSFAGLRRQLAEAYPLVLLILGNDDPRSAEGELAQAESKGLWRYLHGRRLEAFGYRFFGYACIPPSPFLLKDWERYDVSRYVDVGAVSPEEGYRSMPASSEEGAAGTIRHDLERLAGGEEDLSRAVFLFHAPPYGGLLDLADLEGREVEHAPLDRHVGSIAIRRFLESRQPYLSLHGHVHESQRLSGAWRERIGRTWCFSAASEGPRTAVIRFRLEELEEAKQLLL